MGVLREWLLWKRSRLAAATNGSLRGLDPSPLYPVLGSNARTSRRYKLKHLLQESQRGM